MDFSQYCTSVVVAHWFPISAPAQIVSHAPWPAAEPLVLHCAGHRPHVPWVVAVCSGNSTGEFLSWVTFYKIIKSFIGPLQKDSPLHRIFHHLSLPCIYIYIYIHIIYCSVSSSNTASSTGFSAKNFSTAAAADVISAITKAGCGSSKVTGQKSPPDNWIILDHTLVHDA